MNKLATYSLYNIMDIRFADPVSSIALNDKYVIIGSMMGRIAALSIKDRKLHLLAELSTENITGITFENPEIFNIAIGDEEVLKYRFIISHTGQEIADIENRFKNYLGLESEHRNRCDSCFPLMSNFHLALIYLNQPNESNFVITLQSTEIKVKNILTNYQDDYLVEMSNYSVPFDFDGNKIAWVEFLSESLRNICVFYLDTNNKWFYQINKEFGHISHVKILPKNKIFLVRQLNQCEIRDINSEFKLLYKFKNFGDEVIATDFYINSSKILLNDMELDNIQIDKHNDKYVKISIDNNIIKEEENINEENISISLLDIDGNVNIYENFEITKRFNLYEMKDINQDLKNKQFFSMGYPYLIKSNPNYSAISTDHGVLIIKHHS